MKRLVLVFAVALLLAGIAGLIHPVFTYQKKEEVAHVGAFHATVMQEKQVEIPKAASITALLTGLLVVLYVSRIK